MLPATELEAIELGGIFCSFAAAVVAGSCNHFDQRRRNLIASFGRRRSFYSVLPCREIAGIPSRGKVRADLGGREDGGKHQCPGHGSVDENPCATIDRVYGWKLSENQKPKKRIQKYNQVCHWTFVELTIG